MGKKGHNGNCSPKTEIGDDVPTFSRIHCGILQWLVNFIEKHRKISWEIRNYLSKSD